MTIERYRAIGSTYTADGWTPNGPLFQFGVPPGSEAARDVFAYARMLAVHGVGGLARHGCQHVTDVESLPDGRGRLVNEMALRRAGYLVEDDDDF
jgi:hypothetical protein